MIEDENRLVRARRALSEMGSSVSRTNCHSRQTFLFIKQTFLFDLGFQWDHVD